MPFPSGSTLLVTLQPGASPNTGPFDLYINNISPTNLIANDVSKTTLSGSGYMFNTPLETYRVWAKSDSSITTANVAILGNVPGTNASVSVTGSYNSSLNPSFPLAEIFIDNGYGLQSIGTVASNLNTCPSTIGIGTGSINNNFNTLLVVKTNESSSEYVKFFPNGNASSVYFYHIGNSSSIFTSPSNESICIDLSGGGYQTVPINSINVYPTSSIVFSNSTNSQYLNIMTIIKANGNVLFSGSLFFNSQSINFPGNSNVEITASAYISNSYSYLAGMTTTSSLSLSTNYKGLIRSNQINNNGIISGSDMINTYYKFPIISGGLYWLNAVSSGNQIQSWMFDGGGIGKDTSGEACAVGTGGPIYYLFSSPTVDARVYTDLNLTTVFNGQGKWYKISQSGTNRSAIRVESSGLITNVVSC